ncbi:3-methyl-2-oxobutanoate hydroxymethyltransferase [Albibacterium bauzanense]|uniref:3-methyl-2-oxobutanoate hydroxymethyltransferase n=1 Tax=Albibacterium bauzanense TaxID=653929 RepID=A0A4R1LVP8_9SPHI|nr:3-methyl-2-oxobutanoate hydroxymethyltransferase [Albibacterium bauzanense]TCK83506.1 ketopantoate hydroxymethyltransferase [Albibacterium bauzanense]
MSEHKEMKRISTSVIMEMKNSGEKITMLTAYDYSMATILDQAGIEIILVGDSAANVFAGHSTTLPITLDQMIYHASSVVRAVKRAMVIVDLPFGSYQGSSSKGLESAIRIMKESGAHGVKLEGGAEIQETVEKIVSAGIPVVGHLGLTPQSVNQFGGFGVRAKSESEAHTLKNNVHILQEAGCFAVVLEKIPAKLAADLSNHSRIPLIGIGAGMGCDGQVLVVNDMLGLTENFKPKFLRQYLNLHGEIKGAVQQYISDVKDNTFPNTDEQY